MSSAKRRASRPQVSLLNTTRCPLLKLYPQPAREVPHATPRSPPSGFPGYLARFINLLAPPNPVASLLSVVPLATTIVAILVIQSRSKFGIDVVLHLPITENGRETSGDHDTAASMGSMVLRSHRSIHP